jgi:2'-5' RNA ligase
MGFAYDDEENEAGQRHRLFFALLPDDEARKQIIRLGRLLKQVHQSYADLTTPENLHVSMFYVDAWRGRLPEDLFARASAVGAATRAAPFQLAFNQTGTFANPKAMKGKSYPFVLFGERDPGPALTLRRAIGAAMRHHGLAYAVKEVKAFAPHVTLWWDEEILDSQPTAPVAWTARELVLVDSIQSEGRHNHLARWPLGG